MLSCFMSCVRAVCQPNELIRGAEATFLALLGAGKWARLALHDGLKLGALVDMLRSVPLLSASNTVVLGHWTRASAILMDVPNLKQYKLLRTLNI